MDPTPSVFDNPLVQFLVLFGAALGVTGLFFALSVFFGPRKMTDIKSRPFETGILVEAEAQQQPFPIKYYLVAILFIVFDIEVAFLYPWAVGFRDLGLTGFISMMVFLAILLVGLYYAVKKRVLDWK